MIHYQTWTPQAILVSDWLLFLNILIPNVAEKNILILVEGKKII
jgi:hypothetical protein